MAIVKKSQTASEGLSLKSFLEASSGSRLEFTGNTTAKGNPVFSNGIDTFPIAMGLLKYYISKGLVNVEEDDSIDCPKGWKSNEGTWVPKARISQEL